MAYLVILDIVTAMLGASCVSKRCGSLVPLCPETVATGKSGEPGSWPSLVCAVLWMEMCFSFYDLLCLSTEKTQ